MFLCYFCGHDSEVLTNHLDHQNLHSSRSRNKHCGFNNCKMFFKSEKNLKVHVNRVHNMKSRQNLYRKMSETLVQQNRTFICSDLICGRQYYNYQEFMKHLKEHMRNGENVKCPFPNCDKKYRKVSSFTSHVSQHRSFSLTSTVTALSQALVEAGQREYQENHQESSEYMLEIPTALQINTNNSIKDDKPKDYCNNAFDKLFEINWAEMFMKLEAQFLFPVSTIQFLVKEFEKFDLYRLNVLKNHLKEHLTKINKNSEEVDKIIAEVFYKDPLKVCNSKLGTDYRRKKFYKENFIYVGPERILLRKVNGKKAHFHYVPIIVTLKAMFKNKSFDIDLKVPRNEGGVLKDFTDGFVFQSDHA